MPPSLSIHLLITNASNYITDRMNTPPSNLLAKFPAIVTIPVQWGDQDAYQHVNNTVPLRWFESSRIAYVEKLGATELLSELQLGLIIASVSCSYRRQLCYPDQIQVGARVTQLGNSSMTIAHSVYSQSQDAIAVKGEAIMVVFDFDAKRPKRLPATVREAIERIEETTF